MVDGADAEHFRAFVVQRTPALLRLGYLLTGDRHQAEDLLQVALVKTLGRWRSVVHADTRPADLEAYVRKVMYNEQVSTWRRLRHRIENGRDAAVDDGRPDTSWQVDLRLTLHAALLQLTVKQRAVIVMRYYEDLSETQVAGLLGVSVGTVRSQTAKALQRLRTLTRDMDDLWTAKGAV